MVDKRQGMATLRLISILTICATVFVRASSEATGECNPLKYCPLTFTTNVFFIYGLQSRMVVIFLDFFFNKKTFLLPPPSNITHDLYFK